MSTVTVGTDGIAVAAPEATLETNTGKGRERVVALVTGRAATIVLLGASAFALRAYAIRSSIDIFIDEVTYTRIALNIEHGHGVTLDGQPFYLHPPAAFGLFALAVIVLGLHGTTAGVLLSLRSVPAAMGSVACVAAYCIVERAASKRAAIAAAALLAI